jgi:hypothetical protein
VPDIYFNRYVPIFSAQCINIFAVMNYYSHIVIRTTKHRHMGMVADVDRASEPSLPEYSTLYLPAVSCAGLNFIAAWRRIESTTVWLFYAQHCLKGVCFVSGFIYNTSTDDSSAQFGGCGDVMLMFHLYNCMDELDLYLCCSTRPLLLQTRIYLFLNPLTPELNSSAWRDFLLGILLLEPAFR